MTYTNDFHPRLRGRFLRVLPGLLLALGLAFASAPAHARETPAQTESAGFAELRRALDGFLAILALDPQTGEMLQVRSEPGGVEIIRPMAYLDVGAAHVDWVSGLIPQGHAVVAANAVDVLVETQGAAVWMSGDFDAAKAKTPLDMPALFYVTTADDQPVLHTFSDGSRMPMFVKYNDAARFLDTAKRNMTTAAGAPLELKIANMNFLATLQAIIGGEIVGVRLVSPEANLRWAEENRQGRKTLDYFVPDADLAAEALAAE